MVAVSIPATSANLGVLFDKGAIALDAFSNIIEIEEASEFHMDISGLGTGEISDGKENLIYKAIEYFYRETDISMPVFSVKTANEIPLSRGLGSSAACIAGGISAANYFEGKPLSDKDVILMAAKMEGHGDNVCAAVTGGVSLFLGDDYKHIEVKDVPRFILYVPQTTLSTKKSRGILPLTYDDITLEKAKNLEKSMIKALYDSDYEKAGALMEQDVIHQPYRRNLLPYWDDVMSSAKTAGAWGTALSGAGPTMISMCEKEKSPFIAEKVKKAVANKYKLNIIVCEINPDGITLLED